jgi:hypothetical protein
MLKGGSCSLICDSGVALWSERDYSIQYIEYQSVCPFVGIGFPHPLSRKRVSPPTWSWGEGEPHSLVGEGVGVHYV